MPAPAIRAAFFSDVHGNSTALAAVLADTAARKVDRLFSLGDLVGYGPDPNGVIEIVRSREIPSLAVNYDDGVGFERGGCGCYYADAEARRIGDASYAFTVRAGTGENKAWLRGLPRERRLELGGHRPHLVHGSPRRINEYLAADRDERTYRRLAREEQADLLVFGHTHVPWDRCFDKVHFVNVGSAGRPKDGDTRAMYALIELAEAPAGPRIEFIRVPYDFETTARAVLAAGLPPELAQSFREGR